MLVDLCCGEPFLFQLAGQQAWYASEDVLVTADQVEAGWRTAQRGQQRMSNASSGDCLSANASSSRRWLRCPRRTYLTSDWPELG